MKSTLYAAGYFCLLIHASHAAPVSLPVAPSTLPPLCVWMPVWAYGVPYLSYSPVLTVHPPARSGTLPVTTWAPAPPPGQPNWFAPVPGWQALGTPPAGTPAYPCYPASPYPVSMP